MRRRSADMSYTMLSTAPLFHLHELQHTTVRACEHVANQGHPVLHVIRGGDGTWYFFCGRGHRHDPLGGLPLPLKTLVKNDVSLNGVAALAPHDFAERPAADQPWTVGDQLALEIPECIEEHDWFIALVNDESASQNYFSYTIGMEDTLKHPELVMIGASPELMPTLLNELGARIKRGLTVEDGTELIGLIAGRRCVCRAMHPTWYRDYLGYSLWYYGGADFRVLQLVFSDEEGRLPGDEGCDPNVEKVQPDLSSAKQ